MSVLLFNPSTELYIHPPTSPLGLLSVATYLNKNGIKTIIIDRTIKNSPLKKLFDSEAIDIIGISLISEMGLSDAMRISAEAHRRGLTVFWGGHSATAMADSIIAEGYADFIIDSEGEITTLELIRAFNSDKNYTEINGLVFSSDGKLVRTPPRDFCDLSEMDIDWELIYPPDYYQSYYSCRKMLYMYTSKGCPFNCAFCFNPEYHRSKHRKRNIDSVLNEIEYLVINYGMDGVYFCDELFCSNTAELHEICGKLIARKIDFVWGCEARINQYSDEDIELMYKAGCRWIMFGIESGSDKILKDMHKGIRCEQIADTIALCNRLGITVVGSFIIGYPGETIEDLKQTTKLMFNLDINLYSPNHFAPQLQSAVYKQLISENKLNEPSSLAERKGIQSVEYVYTNYSNIPTVDLITVRAFFLWVAFSQKNTVSKTKSFQLAKKSISDGAKNAFRYGFFRAIPRCAVAAKIFLYYMYHAYAHGEILKKYGLSYKVKKEMNKQIRDEKRTKTV